MPAVLLVEDDDVVLRCLRWVLADAGLEAIPVASAGEARRSLAVRRPDVAVVDMLLPDGDGGELIAELRRQRPGLPVVAVSSDPTPQRRRDAHAAGASLLLPKPFGAVELLAAIASARGRA